MRPVTVPGSVRTRTTSRAWGWIGGMVAASILMFGSSPAVAADGSTQAEDGPQVDRVIDNSSEKLPVMGIHPNSVDSRSTAQESFTVAGEIPLPTGVKLTVGETVQVNYSDGVAVHHALSAACTTSATAYNPYMGQGQVRASHSISRSSGCSGGYLLVGELESYAPPFWHKRNSGSNTVQPGTTAFVITSKLCVNTSSKLWKARTLNVTLLAVSPEVSLPCNPG